MYGEFSLIEKFIAFSMGYSVDFYTWTDYKGTHTEMVPDFIMQIKWNCETSHIINIWKDKVEEVVSPEGRMNLFWYMLDSYNQHQLVDYIVNNYNA